MKEIDFVVGGMMGDFIHTLQVVKNICRKEDAIANIYLTDNLLYGGDKWRYGIEQAHDDLKYLVIWQDYVKLFDILSEPLQTPFINLNYWRTHIMNLWGKEGGYKHSWTEFLSTCYAYPLDNSAWITAPFADYNLKNTVVIHRSKHRHNPLFNWDNVIEQIKDPVLFLTSDTSEFCTFEGHQKVKIKLVSSVADMVSAIASCKYFIGNQSMPFALASALDKPRMVELDAEPAPFYIGEAKYSKNISYYLDENTKFNAENSLIKL